MNKFTSDPTRLNLSVSCSNIGMLGYITFYTLSFLFFRIYFLNCQRINVVISKFQAMVAHNGIKTITQLQLTASVILSINNINCIKSIIDNRNIARPFLFNIIVPPHISSPNPVSIRAYISSNFSVIESVIVAMLFIEPLSFAQLHPKYGQSSFQ